MGGRRLAAGCVLSLALAGCAGPPGDDDGARPGSPPPSSAAVGDPPPPSSPGTPAPQSRSTLPAATTWAPGPGEVHPEIKLAATAYLELAGTWSTADQSGPATQQERLVAAGVAPAAAAAATALADEGADAATVTIGYPQFGGVTAAASSIMTTLTQRVQRGEEVQERSMTLDVRLAATPTGWAVSGVERLPPLAGSGTLGPNAQAVLANPNVRLPGAAEADLRTGALDEAMLGILNGLAQQRVLDVAVFYDGHPPHVFETGRVSNHHVGRAVDIWAVDGRPVASLRGDRAALDPVLAQAGQLGATEVGAPYDLNAERPGYFTDTVHQDHVHVGVSPGKPPAVP